jgi:thiol-disulfide isomerase/thioredoxin
MHVKKVFAVLSLFGLFLATHAQVDFREISSAEEMDRAWADAERENKPVFVDIYATWCGPCKWMDANVFALEEAGSYMNEAFINVKMDGESEFGRQFALRSGLSAYPSFFVYHSEQKLMNMIVGAKPWEELEPVIASTLEFYPVLEVLQSKFESGLLKQEEYPRFMKALREMGKDKYAEAVAGTYEQAFVEGAERSPEDLRVLAFFTRQQTDNWSHLTSDISRLRDALGDDLEMFIDHAVTKAIESAVEESALEYLRALAKILPELTKGTSMDPQLLESRMYVYFFHYSEQFDALVGYIDEEYEANHKGDHEWLFEAASNAVFLDPRNSVLAEKGLGWFQRCIDLKETHAYYYHLALCEYFTGSPEKTVQTLKRSLAFTDDPEMIASTQSIIAQVSEELSE